MQTPIYETADDPRVFRHEQQRARYGRDLCALLVRASGCYDERALVLEEEARAREALLVHLAELARDGLAAWPGRWTPSAMLLRALGRYGLTWADVEARL